MSRRELTPADSKRRLINLFAVLLPPGGLAVAIALLWGTAIDAVSLSLFLGFSVMTALGITVGFHRLCTHRAFTTPAPVRYMLAAAGSMAVQGPVITWCAEHRRHHVHSDTEGDPHSPHMGDHGSWGEGWWATLRGAFHAHLGWLFAPHQGGLGRYSRDLERDPVLVAVDRQFRLWVLIGLIAPAVIGGVITLSWYGAITGFLWGGLIRVMAVHHVTWSVNSICHLWGSRPYESGDESRNNFIVGVLAMGEGWHNNHHAFPSSARHGLRWWELDASWWLIRLLSSVGLAKDIRLPSHDRVSARRRGSPIDRRSVSGPVRSDDHDHAAEHDPVLPAS
ncbi:MAG: fatty acid desaturase [Phycisphaeraceae bacterium]|nr:fatty acid desaturase [Phycisphaeraceae bacterium]